MKQGEKHIRDQYFKAFGHQYDCVSRPAPPLPLYIAYQIALRKLKEAK